MTRLDARTATAPSFGADVGGTTTRVGLVDSAGRILALHKIDTPRDDAGDALLRFLVDAIDTLPHSHLVSSQGYHCHQDAVTVGLALPGPVDRLQGCLIRSVNLPFLQGRPIVAELVAATGQRVTLMTDADAATWGDYAIRNPPPPTLAHLRLGTGVALGMVLGGQLHPLNEGRSTHLEMLVVESGPRAVTCRCGLRGCLEAYVSGIALNDQAKHAGYGGLAHLRAAWIGGEPAALRLLEAAAEAFAIAIVNIRAKLQPVVLTVGGGVVAALPALISLAAARVHRAEHTNSATPAIVVSQLGDDAGVIGAALYAAQS